MPLFLTVAPPAAGGTVPLGIAIGLIVVAVILGFVLARRRAA